MTKAIGVFIDTDVSSTEKRVHAGHWMSGSARRVVSFFGRQKERDIERFIRERGGVFTDEIERAIDQKYWRERSLDR